MNFCIDKMTNEEMNLLAQTSVLASPVFREATLVFGGVRHQSAAFYGVEPEIGEECHIERRWKGHQETIAGSKGTVHLVNDEGLSYGLLIQAAKKVDQLKMLGVHNIKTNQKVRNNSNYFYLKYIVTDIVRDLDTIHFVSVKGVI